MQYDLELHLAHPSIFDETDTRGIPLYHDSTVYLENITAEQAVEINDAIDGDLSVTTDWALDDAHAFFEKAFRCRDLSENLRNTCGDIVSELARVLTEGVQQRSVVYDRSFGLSLTFGLIDWGMGKWIAYEKEHGPAPGRMLYANSYRFKTTL